MSEWTLEAVTKRILDECVGMQGENIRRRQGAIVQTWLETVERQERERCAKMMTAICGHSVHGVACTWCLMAKRIRG